MIDKMAEIVRVLFQRVSIERILASDEDKKIYYNNLDMDYLQDLLLTYNEQFSDTEIRHKIRETQVQMREYEALSSFMSESGKINVFSALFYYITDILVINENKVVCRYNRLLEWNRITRHIGEELPIAARIAMHDYEHGMENTNFCWPPILNHNNKQMERILKKGISDNHFHLRGSMPYFYVSWINLMNHPENPFLSKNLKRLESNLRDKQKKYEMGIANEHLYILILKASVIRLYLGSCIKGFQVQLMPYFISTAEVWSEVKRCKYLSLFSERFIETLSELLKPNSYAGKTIRLIKVLETMETSRKVACQFPYLMNFFYLFGNFTIPRMILEERKEGREKNKSTDIIERLVQDIIVCFPKLELNECRACISPQIFAMHWRQQTWRVVLRLLRNNIFLDANIRVIQNAMDSILDMKGHFDYMQEFFHDNSKYQEYKVLSGERWFEYYMLKCILTNNSMFSRQEYNLFYAYLRIKNELRMELVQSNHQVGFENFQIYQKRKDWFTNSGDFLETEGMLARMAVRDVLNNRAVQSLEMRISPANSSEDNAFNIREYDNAITRPCNDEERFWNDVHKILHDQDGNMTGNNWESKDLRKRYYYVLHFTKEQDNGQLKFVSNECRHYEYRRKIKEKARAIMKFRENYQELAGRVLGIDASGQEIGCRPEVFARVFRVLKKHSLKVFEGNEYELPQLKITYHVGEDFLDVVDGLRAIDEAVRFLKMDCGDRLGHALALGIDAKEWYKLKGHHITLPLHDYLDNVVWLHHALIKFQIGDMSALKGWLEEQFSHYFTYIYKPQNTRIDKAKFDINVYYLAWLLRGDKPSMYLSGEFRPTKVKADPWEHYAVCEEKRRKDDIRKIPEVALLYHMYHYDAGVREKGSETSTRFISDLYVEGVTRVQRAMQEMIVQRGIAVELNPSSNLYISTFDHLSNHPIKNFYNLGLIKNEKELMECPQMNVSINTDDKAVFSTRLENEYALLACAMEDVAEDGKSRYKREFIYEWLDYIREMGLRQSFQRNEE